MESNVDTIVQKLKEIPFCEGIIYAGSRAEGDFVATSDYDFTVLVSEGKSYYEIFQYKGFLVDVCCATLSVITKKDLVRNRVSNPELSIIAHGKIVFDKSGQMNKLHQKAKEVWSLGPTNDLKEAGHLCKLFLHRLHKPNSEAAHYSWNVMIEKTIRIFFELHKEWLPKFLKVEDRIKEIDKDFFTLYKKAFSLDSTNRVKATKQMIQYLIRKFDLPQTGEMYIEKAEN